MEFEFIHPFEDGNGRMGRLWQTLILTKFNPIFEYIPVESQIHAHQAEYYRVLEACDKKGDSTEFIEWMLRIIFTITQGVFQRFACRRARVSRRVSKSRVKSSGIGIFTRADYLKLIKTISAPTASRDLAHAVKTKILQKSGDKRLTAYSFR